MNSLEEKITWLVASYPRVSIIGRKEKGYRFVVSVKDDAGNNLAVGKAFTVMSALDQVIAKLTNGA